MKNIYNKIEKHTLKRYLQKNFLNDENQKTTILHYLMNFNNEIFDSNWDLLCCDVNEFFDYILDSVTDFLLKEDNFNYETSRLSLPDYKKEIPKSIGDFTSLIIKTLYQK